MNIEALKAAVEEAPVRNRETLRKIYLYVTAGDAIKEEFSSHLTQAQTSQEFLDAIFDDATFKETLVWAEIARMSRKNWLRFFEPKLLVENLRMKTDGLPIQMGTGVVLAPTGSRDNIASLYLFENGGFNRQAAEFVTSLGGTFTLAEFEFCGIYGLYKYRGSVILEEWDPERDPVRKPDGPQVL